MGYISPTLAVRDVKQTIQFYRDSLGFKTGMTFPNADKSMPIFPGMGWFSCLYRPRISV